MCYIVIVYRRSEVVDNDLFTCHTKTGPTLQKKRFVLNSSRKTLQNLPYFVYKKTHQVFPFFILCNFEFTIYECPSQPCFYTSKCIRRQVMSVRSNSKQYYPSSWIFLHFLPLSDMQKNSANTVISVLQAATLIEADLEQRPQIGRRDINTSRI